MVKRGLALSLALLYSLTAIGMPLHFHYCRGELKHITLLLRMSCHEQESQQTVKTCCGQSTTAQCMPEVAVDACCMNATQWLFENRHAPLPSAQMSIWVSAPFPAPEAFQGECLEGDSICATSDDNTPGKSPPLFVMHCALMFYG